MRRRATLRGCCATPSARTTCTRYYAAARTAAYACAPHALYLHLHSARRTTLPPLLTCRSLRTPAAARNALLPAAGGSRACYRARTAARGAGRLLLDRINARRIGRRLCVTLLVLLRYAGSALPFSNGDAPACVAAYALRALRCAPRARAAMRAYTAYAHTRVGSRAYMRCCCHAHHTAHTTTAFTIAAFPLPRTLPLLPRAHLKLRGVRIADIARLSFAHALNALGLGAVWFAADVCGYRTLRTRFTAFTAPPPLPAVAACLRLAHARMGCLPQRSRADVGIWIFALIVGMMR